MFDSLKESTKEKATMGIFAFAVGLGATGGLGSFIAILVTMVDRGSQTAEYVLIAAVLLMFIVVFFGATLLMRYIDIKGMWAMSEIGIESQRVNAMENVALTGQAPQQLQHQSQQQQQQEPEPEYLIVDPRFTQVED